MNRVLLALTAFVICLAACAAAPPNLPADATDGLRVLVELAPEATSGGASDERPASVERRATASAGVPVRYVAASGARWHALMLICSPTECDAALQRLTADRAGFLVVQRDELRRR
ncbi:MAG: hypothetical protein KA439_03990 [Rhizobacter sp.]|jgi:hypothetical protein|nr:hypothetical protein [Rhizobacter sp.]MBP6268586.1 hypothetical protein [Rhizobacter sp.]